MHNTENTHQKESFSHEEYWEFEKPPTLFDLIRNNMLSNSIRLLIHLGIRFVFKYYYKFTTHNADQLTHTSSCLIIANHTSHLDALAILSAFPLLRVNSVHSIAAKDYFFSNALFRMIAFFIANTIPLDRHKRDQESFLYCTKRLAEGSNVLIFPEGTRSLDGQMHTFKTGIGVLVLQSRCTVVPAYIQGAYESFGKFRIFPHPGQIKIIFGDKINYPDLENTKDNRHYIARDLESRTKQLEKRAKGIE
ncbi:MAG: lysophospholipid acyltransferase family protein [bacterium]